MPLPLTWAKSIEMLCLGRGCVCSCEDRQSWPMSLGPRGGRVNELRVYFQALKNACWLQFTSEMNHLSIAGCFLSFHLSACWFITLISGGSARHRRTGYLSVPLLRSAIGSRGHCWWPTQVSEQRPEDHQEMGNCTNNNSNDNQVLLLSVSCMSDIVLVSCLC